MVYIISYKNFHVTSFLFVLPNLINFHHYCPHFCFLIYSTHLDPILNSIKTAGWSAENVSFGSGGALLQRLNRDTQKCAFKSSFAIVNGHKVNK